MHVGLSKYSFNLVYGWKRTQWIYVILNLPLSTRLPLPSRHRLVQNTAFKTIEVLKVLWGVYSAHVMIDGSHNNVDKEERWRSVGFWFIRHWWCSRLFNERNGQKEMDASCNTWSSLRSLIHFFLYASPPLVLGLFCITFSALNNILLRFTYMFLQPTILHISWRFMFKHFIKNTWLIVLFALC